MRKFLTSLPLWWRSVLRKRRFSVSEATSRVEEWHIHLSPASVFAAFLAFGLFLFIIILSLVAYTPVLEFLPGYRTDANKSRESLIHNTIRLDSMERMMNDMMTYNDNIALILEGKTPVVRTLSNTDSTRQSKTLVMPSAEDSLLRLQIKGTGRYGLESANNTTRRAVRESIEMVTPIEGIITDRFNIPAGRFGVRLAAAPGDRVSAIANGTVVMSIWTPETGYIVQIQHPDALLSVYKNMSKSLVTMGQTVKNGEIIGYNTEIAAQGSDSRLFEFALWNNGKPVDPEGYIVF